MTLSVCIIAHNEEDNLPRALESVRFADEVIVGDSESTDQTARIAEHSGAIVFPRPNLDNLNVNKNFTFDQAKGDFILCLDADEAVPPQTAEEILNVMKSNPAESGFFLPRRNHWMGRWLKHGGQYPDWQLRLFRQGKGRFPELHLHERLKVEGRIRRLHHPLDHFPYESREECQRKLDFYTTFEAKHLYDEGFRPSMLRKIRYMHWMPAQRFLRRYFLKLGFLDGRSGWEAVQMDMQNFQLRYSKLCKLAIEGENDIKRG